MMGTCTYRSAALQGMEVSSVSVWRRCGQQPQDYEFRSASGNLPSAVSHVVCHIMATVSKLGGRDGAASCPTSTVVGEMMRTVGVGTGVAALRGCL